MDKNSLSSQVLNIDNLLTQRDTINGKIRTTLINVISELQENNGCVFLYKDMSDIDIRPLTFHDDYTDDVENIIALRVVNNNLQALVSKDFDVMPKSIDEVDDDLWFNVYHYGELDYYEVVSAIYPLL